MNHYVQRLRALFLRNEPLGNEPFLAESHAKKAQNLNKVPELETIFLALAAQKRSGLKVVQVGANDGVTNDPVFSLFHRFAESVLLIEPQPELIPRLRENYSSFEGKLVIANMAVTAEESSMKLFELTKQAGEKYHAATGFNPTGIAAGREEHLASHLLKYNIVAPGEISSAIKWQEVPSRPLKRILEINGIAEIDFLQIDTEGADWLVLQTLGSHRPPAINFEWVHLNSQDWSDCHEWMAANRYLPFFGERDCLLIRDFSR
jgi:FkbM family methyltransferase